MPHRIKIDIIGVLAHAPQASGAYRRRGRPRQPLAAFNTRKAPLRIGAIASLMSTAGIIFASHLAASSAIRACISKIRTNCLRYLPMRITGTNPRFHGIRHSTKSTSFRCSPLLSFSASRLKHRASACCIPESLSLIVTRARRSISVWRPCRSMMQRSTNVSDVSSAYKTLAGVHVVSLLWSTYISCSFLVRS